MIYFGYKSITIPLIKYMLLIDYMNSYVAIYNSLDLYKYYYAADILFKSKVDYCNLHKFLDLEFIDKILLLQ